jgi:hypothetical protein
MNPLIKKHLKLEVNSCAAEGLSVPVPLVIAVVLL